jgi:hypothetical protein
VVSVVQHHGCLFLLIVVVFVAFLALVFAENAADAETDKTMRLVSLFKNQFILNCILTTATSPIMDDITRKASDLSLSEVDQGSTLNSRDCR